MIDLILAGAYLAGGVFVLALAYAGGGAIVYLVGTMLLIVGGAAAWDALQ